MKENHVKDHANMILKNKVQHQEKDLNKVTI